MVGLRLAGVLLISQRCKMGKTEKDVCLCLVGVLWTVLVVLQLRRTNTTSVVIVTPNANSDSDYVLKVKWLKMTHAGRVSEASVIQRLFLGDSRAVDLWPKATAGDASDAADSSTIIEPVAGMADATTDEGILDHNISAVLSGKPSQSSFI